MVFFLECYIEYNDSLCCSLFFLICRKLRTLVSTLKLVASKVSARSRYVIAGIPVIRHLCAEAMLPISCVSHDLRPAVRKLHPIFTANDIAVANSVMGIIIAESVLLHSIIEVEGHAGFMMMMVVLYGERYIN